jgi:hypothetical protein
MPEASMVTLDGTALFSIEIVVIKLSILVVCSEKSFQGKSVLFVVIPGSSPSQMSDWLMIGRGDWTVLGHEVVIGGILSVLAAVTTKRPYACGRKLLKNSRTILEQ